MSLRRNRVGKIDFLRCLPTSLTFIVCQWQYHQDSSGRLFGNNVPFRQFTAVQLKAAEEAYAQFVKVGTVVTDITDTATIKAAVNADETKIVLTVTPHRCSHFASQSSLSLGGYDWRRGLHQVHDGQVRRRSPPAPPESNNRTI